MGVARVQQAFANPTAGKQHGDPGGTELGRGCSWGGGEKKKAGRTKQRKKLVFSMAGLDLTEIRVNLGVFVGKSAQKSIPLPDGQNSPANLNMSMRWYLEDLHP